MKKQIRKFTGGLLVAGLVVVGLTTGAKAYAVNADNGAAAASVDADYSLEEMLVYAIEDEYLAQAEYEIIMDTFGIQKPFSNIIKAEATHISLLEPLFEEYGVSIPEKEWESLVVVPESLEAAYAIGVDAEEKNIAMYESFLKEELPDEVRDVFDKLMNASVKHLRALQRQVDGVSCGSGSRNGNCEQTGAGRQKGNNGVGGNGQGSRCTLQENCIVD